MHATTESQNNEQNKQQSHERRCTLSVQVMIHCRAERSQRFAVEFERVELHFAVEQPTLIPVLFDQNEATLSLRQKTTTTTTTTKKKRFVRYTLSTVSSLSGCDDAKSK
jgi:hypothetical protein